MTPQSCSGCPSKLSHRNTSGLCRSCLAYKMGTDRQFLTARTAKLREAFACPLTRDQLVEQRRAASHQRMAWCPERYRADYYRLTRVKGLRTSVARTLTEELMAAEERRQRATVHIAAAAMLEKHRREVASRY